MRALTFVLRMFQRDGRGDARIKCLVAAGSGLNDAVAEARVEAAIKQMLSADDRIDITLTSFDRRQTLHHVSESGRVHVAEVGMFPVVGIARLVVRSDIVILTDGECFTKLSPQRLFRVLMSTVSFAQALGIPTVAYGVGAGDLPKSRRRRTMLVANGIDLLIVRSQFAKEALQKMGVTREIEVTADPAFELLPEEKQWAETVYLGQGVDIMRPIIGIAFRDDGGHRQKKCLAEFADWAAKRLDAQTVIFAMSHADVEACRELGSLMNSRHVLYDADHATAPQMSALLECLDLLVSSSYHGCVLAMGGSVPVIMLSQEGDVKELVSETDLAEQGGPEMFEALKERTMKIFEEGKKLRKQLAADFSKFVSRSARNGKLFAEFVARKCLP